ncbi:hypothetical protein HMPREF1624_05560 [Sporothrix schenckii ATCC 58251]|uniref:Peptidase S1 domain-containing protein n=1 Tax=Sporothrix schenckii (strain ATCC 58251 / de Perez 2211183) TaxID=1391915 RepID=U7PP59_SPOS1|nr:hypothetical protein HMPREF1624_05560 [Sporothrix schenckii ATCC 58251]
MDSLRAEDVSIETADVTSPIDDTEGSESLTESRRGKNKSDETQASSIDSQEVTKTEPPAARPPHFQEPSKDEAAMFYQWLPSQPILLGRTSSLSLPWDNAMAAPRRGAWNYGKEDTSMSCGPVVSGSSETANPVWALTCHHVVYPEEDDTTKYNRAKIVMPSRTELNSALQNINSVITNAWHLVNGHRGPPDAQNIVDRQVLERATKLREKLTSFRASDNAAVVGHVHRAPDVAVNDHPGEPRYTRDWALIALDRAKFPDNFDFQNYVDLKADRPGSILGSINEYLDGPDRFIMPTNELMRLSGTVTLDKIRGRPKQHALVATRDDDSYFVVLKRGVKTGLTVGVALDMRSVCRQSIGTEMVESFEWLVVHISAKRFDARWPLENVFSSEGDSGAAVFDLQGRVAGMITGGTARSERAVTGMDFTYITPMAHLLADIERELGFEVKIL